MRPDLHTHGSAGSWWDNHWRGAEETEQPDGEYVGRSLKEALLDQFELLQERGLAPSEVPREDDRPMIVVEASTPGQASRGRRDASDRFSEEDGLDVGAFDEKGRRRAPRREHHTEEARDRRRPTRGRGREAGGPEAELLLPLGSEPSGPPLRRAPMGVGPRPVRPGMGAPRPLGPPRMPVPGRTEMLQQRAEQRRAEQEEISELRRLLGELSGQEVDDAALDEFSKALSEETGALPPPRIVVDAMKQVKSADPKRIGDAVRAYYRRPRTRPAVAGAAPALVPSVAASV